MTDLWFLSLETLIVNACSVDLLFGVFLMGFSALYMTSFLISLEFSIG